MWEDLGAKGRYSHVVVPAEKLRGFVEHVLKTIEAKEEKVRARLIKEKIEEHRKSRWRRFWRKPVYTEEQAAWVLYNNDQYFPTFHLRDLWLKEKRTLPLKLLNACEFAKEVRVSAADLQELRDHLPNDYRIDF